MQKYRIAYYNIYLSHYCSNMNRLSFIAILSKDNCEEFKGICTMCDTKVISRTQLEEVRVAKTIAGVEGVKAYLTSIDIVEEYVHT